MSKVSKFYSKKTTKKSKFRRSITQIDIIDDTQVEAVVNALTSKDEQTVFISLQKLDIYTSKEGDQNELSLLQEYGLLNKLMPIVDKGRNNLTLALQLVVKLTKLEGVIDDLRRNQDFVELLTWLFVENEELDVQQHVTYLLSRLCKSYKCALMLCHDEIIEKIFDILIEKIDASLMLNSLKMFLRIINREKLRRNLQESIYYKLDVFNNFLENEYLVLRPVVIKIIHTFSTWNINDIHEYIFLSDTLSHLFEILSDPYWSETQITCIEIIENSIKYHPIQNKMLESEGFIYFVNYAFKESKEHALAALKLLTNLLKCDVNREILIQREIYKMLPEYSKIDCDCMLVKLYLVMGEFCKCLKVARDLANERVLSDISKFVSKTHLPWNPDRQIAIQPLYRLLNSNPDLGAIFFRHHLFKQLRDALTRQNELDESYYCMTLQVCQILQKNKSFHSYLWTKEVYSQLVNLIECKNKDIANTSMNIIQGTLYHCQYRQWFIEMNGIEIIVNITKMPNNKSVNKMIVFIENIVKYRDLSKKLLNTELIESLNTVSVYVPSMKQHNANIINSLYTCDLSMKFFKTNTLDSNDITQNDFCAYIGVKPANYPPIEVKVTPVVNSDVIYLTVFDSTQKKNIKQRKIESHFSKYRSMYAKYNLPKLDFDPGQDIFVKSYIKKLTKLLEGKIDLTERVGILAKYVCSCLNNYAEKGDKEAQYVHYMNELKLKLHTNFIPIGSLRIGKMAERAILFKILADRLEIPCSLHRKNDTIVWNEIFISMLHPEGCAKCYVLDLLSNDGKLVLKGGQEASLYCSGRS